jgi:penicillin-binding protein 2
MKEACSTGGTGWPLFDFKTKNGPVQTACKTGTAETQAKSGLPDAWITVFAPFNNPEIALTVLVEEGGEGSNIAGPIAKEILKAYFERSQ